MDKDDGPKSNEEPFIGIYLRDIGHYPDVPDHMVQRGESVLAGICGADSVIVWEISLSERPHVRIVSVIAKALWIETLKRFEISWADERSQEIGVDGTGNFIVSGDSRDCTEFRGLVSSLGYDGAVVALDLWDYCPVSTELTGFPRIWELFGFVLSHRTRARVFLPAYADLLSDYLTTRKKRYQTRWARYWLNLCFTFRTIGLVFECLRVTWLAAGAAAIVWFFPPSFRRRLADWLFNGPSN